MYGTILKTTNGVISFVEETKLPESTFNIYPNPANNKITITGNRTLSGITIIIIFNVNGEQLMHDTFRNQNMIEMDVSMLTKGIYLLKIQTTMGITTKKLVIQYNTFSKDKKQQDHSMTSFFVSFISYSNELFFAQCKAPDPNFLNVK